MKTDRRYQESIGAEWLWRNWHIGMTSLPETTVREALTVLMLGPLRIWWKS